MRENEKNQSVSSASTRLTVDDVERLTAQPNLSKKLIDRRIIIGIVYRVG